MRANGGDGSSDESHDIVILRVFVCRVDGEMLVPLVVCRDTHECCWGVSAWEVVVEIDDGCAIDQAR